MTNGPTAAEAQAEAVATLKNLKASRATIK